MLNLYRIRTYNSKDIKEMGWKGISDFCRDLGINKDALTGILFPAEVISISCDKKTEKEILTSKKKRAVHFIIHGRLYWEAVESYEVGNCLVITDKEFEKLF